MFVLVVFAGGAIASRDHDQMMHKREYVAIVRDALQDPPTIV
jgi:hypothetical protein